MSLSVRFLLISKITKLIRNSFFAIFLIGSIGVEAQSFVTADAVTDYGCEGTLYDTGGFTDFIQNNIDVTYTICPEQGLDLRTTLNFTNFNFPENLPNSSLVIYDADDLDNAALIYDSTNGVQPELLEASDLNLSGCLTIRVITGVVDDFSPFYEAIVSCVEPCQIIESKVGSIVPSIIENGEYFVDFNVELTLTAEGIFGDGFSENATYIWDFGDGNTATGQVVNHTYTQVNTFQISVSIIDANGCESYNDLNKNITVIFSDDVAGTGCPFIDLPDIIELGCSDSGEVINILQADFFDTGGTEQYEVSEIPYIPPFPFFGGSFVDITTDDEWSPLIELGFEFVFFEETYENAIVTDNGAVSFHIEDITPTGTYVPGGDSGFSFFENIPVNPGDFGPPYLNAVLGVLQDLDPTESPSDYSINFQVLGEAPCRALVFNLFNLGHFSCNTDNGTQTSQIVLYESTNAIDVYVEQRTPCPDFNAGSGTIGIQNSTGTIGYAPPGRNTGAWSANEEAWRFTPSGESIVSVIWYDENDNILGTGGELTLTPELFGFDITLTEPQEAEIRVVATYEINDNPEDDIIVEDISTVVFRQEYEIFIDEEFIGCSTVGAELELEFNFFNNDLTEDDLSIEWYYNDSLIEGENDNTLIAFEGGEYVAVVTTNNCSSSTTTSFLVFDPPAIDTPDDITIQAPSFDNIIHDLSNYDLAYFGLDPNVFEIHYY
jgi:hypothetical protein